ncbi:MAG: MEDS domain-containing protein [Candidatus Bathyarchaeia archaeon]
MVERFVLDSARKIPPFSHVVIFYNTFYDKWRILLPFIKRNMEEKNSILYFSNGPLDDIPSIHGEAGINLAEARRKRGLTVSDGERWYLAKGSPGKTRIFNIWMESVRDALSKGFRGLCILCEPISFFGLDPRMVLRYEKSLPKRFSRPISVVCQYSVEDLLSLEDGTVLLRLADAHSHVVTPSFVGSIDLANYYLQSLMNSLDDILGETISSVFFSFLRAKKRYSKGTKSNGVEGLGRHLKEFFGEDAARIIKNHVLKEQYQRIGLRFRSLL